MDYKKIILTISLLSVIALFFWTSSRYPQLNEKALMGGNTPSMGISFDILYEIEEGTPLWKKSIFNTLNWIKTNKKGMIFGLLFAAALILLFTELKDHQFKKPWQNALMGLIIGAPLGVCVNCAAPIAMGMSNSGGRAETALSTMISSPTLNIIVLSMLFSLFPNYLVILKLSFTFIFILIFIPFITKIFPIQTVNLSVEVVEQTKMMMPFIPETPKTNFVNNWLKAIYWLGLNYIKALWYIGKMAIPLMLLAGILGNILITLLPLEALVGLLPSDNNLLVLLSMLFLSFFGTFLPVPIAFDVIIMAVLLNLNMPTKYAMVLLFSLGIFSIYSFFVVYKAMSLKLAITMYLGVMGFGILAGGIGHYWERYLKTQIKFQYKWLKETETKPWQLKSIANNSSPKPFESIHHRLEEIQFQKSRLIEMDAHSKIELYYSTFKNKDTSSKKFKKIEGPNIGLEVPYYYSIINLIQPFSNQRSITTGDIHKDGYPDVLICSADSIILFANIKGEQFLRQNLPFNKEHIMNAAFVDINNDSWLDIFVMTFKEGNFIIKNNKGNFDEAVQMSYPNTLNTTLTQSVSFGDLDKNGLLDIIEGNWHSMQAYNFSLEQSKNIGYWNMGGELDLKKFNLEGENGETLSTLISDFNMDGNLDVIIGNDFEVSDFYYLGDGGQELKLIKNSQEIIPNSTKYTMSITTADIDNDTKPEIYLVQNNTDYPRQSNSIDIPCSYIEDPALRKECRLVFLHHKQAREFYQNLESKSDFDLAGFTVFGLYTRHYPLYPTTNTEIWDKYIPMSWTLFSDYFLDIPNYKENYISAKDFKEWLPQKFIEQKGEPKISEAVLLMKNNKNPQQYQYEDVVNNFGIEKTGWAWNSKFADLNNDGWQDLFIVNGFFASGFRQYSNIYYQNFKGQTFQDKTIENGLDNYLPTGSYSYFDFDFDGDLDILACPVIGPIFLYENQNQNQSISFELRDEIGNYFGIGSKIYIEYGNNNKQYREVVLGGGFKSFDESVVHFGLGNNQKIDKVKIHWSIGGITEINQPLKTNRRYKIIRKKKND